MLQLDAGAVAAPLFDASAAPGAGKQSEVEVTFELPSEPSIFGVVVLGGSPDAVPPDGLFFFVNTSSRHTNTSGTYDITVGARPADPHAKPAPKQHHQPLPFPRLSKLRLSPVDTNLTMSLYVDHTVVECFFQGGRTTMSVISTPLSGVPNGADASVSVLAKTGKVLMQQAVVWQINSIWVN